MWFQREKATQFLTELLDDKIDEKVLALLCTGIAKLVLMGMITDQNVSSIRTVAYDPWFICVVPGGSKAGRDVRVTEDGKQPGTSPSLDFRPASL